MNTNIIDPSITDLWKTILASKPNKRLWSPEESLFALYYLRVWDKHYHTEINWYNENHIGREFREAIFPDKQEAFDNSIYIDLFHKTIGRSKYAFNKVTGCIKSHLTGVNVPGAHHGSQIEHKIADVYGGYSIEELEELCQLMLGLKVPEEEVYNLPIEDFVVDVEEPKVISLPVEEEIEEEVTKRPNRLVAWFSRIFRRAA